MNKGDLVNFTNRVQSTYQDGHKIVMSGYPHDSRMGIYLGSVNIYEGTVNGLYDDYNNYESSVFSQSKTVRVLVICPIETSNGIETKNYIKPIYCLSEHVTPVTNPTTFMNLSDEV